MKNFLKNFSLCFFSILLVLMFIEIGLRLAGEKPRHLYDISNNEVITNDMDDGLGWKPKVSIEEGLKLTINWFLKNKC